MEKRNCLLGHIMLVLLIMCDWLLPGYCLYLGGGRRDEKGPVHLTIINQRSMEYYLCARKEVKLKVIPVLSNL